MRKNNKTLKEKAVSGVFYLGIKRIALQVIFTLSNVILARILFPEDFGTFAIVGFIGTLFLVFADLGLGPALVQKKEKVKLLDLQTAYTFQIVLALLIIAVLFITAPYIVKFFNLGEVGVNLIRFYSLFFLFGPFKTTSGAILEKNLDYAKLVSVELLEVSFSAITTVILALAGYGVYSFAVGAVIGHLVGGLSYFRFYPWKIRLKIGKVNFWSLSKFGVPLQINTILGLFYGPLILLYLGKTVGSGNLGFFQFAASLSVLPLAVSEIVNRVIFPLGSRLQADKPTFRKITERSLIIISVTTLPLLAIGLSSAREIIHFVYTDKWLPSLPALYFGLIQTSMIAYIGVFSQLLLARGRAKYMRNMAFVWAVLTWLIAPPLIAKFNFVGMSMTGLLVASSGVWLFIKLRQEIEFSIVNVLPYIVSSTLCGFSVFWILVLLPSSLWSLILALILGVSVYLLCLFLLAKETILENLGMSVSLFVKRR